mmetsp:Transcript_1065/g.2492  ORF Transcript_1065/g.2492 Transcript_1065/m.2492 type:complete len:221 (-) Transcript_1065:493-1155(-)
MEIPSAPQKVRFLHKMCVLLQGHTPFLLTALLHSHVGTVVGFFLHLFQRTRGRNSCNSLRRLSRSSKFARRRRGIDGGVPSGDIHFLETFITMNHLLVVRNVQSGGHHLRQEEDFVLGIHHLLSLKFHCVQDARECNGGMLPGQEPVVAHAQLGEEAGELTNIVSLPIGNRMGDEGHELPHKRKRSGRVHVPPQSLEDAILHGHNVFFEEVAPAEVNEGR